MGWTSPFVLTADRRRPGRAGRSSASIETRVAEPMFHLPLFRIRAVHRRQPGQPAVRPRPRRAAVHADHLAAGHLAAPARLQLRARRRCGPGIYMLPLTVGFLVAGPIVRLPLRPLRRPAVRHRRHARGRALVPAARAAAGRLLLPAFAVILLLNGIGMGLFASPNRAGIMNSLPPEQRGVGARHERHVPELGHGALDRRLLHADDPRPRRLAAAALPRPDRPRRAAADAARIAHLPPVSILFAAFLGYNPIQTLLGPALTTAAPATPPPDRPSFFPSLISPRSSTAWPSPSTSPSRLPGRRASPRCCAAAGTCTRSTPPREVPAAAGRRGQPRRRRSCNPGGPDRRPARGRDGHGGGRRQQHRTGRRPGAGHRRHQRPRPGHGRARWPAAGATVVHHQPLGGAGRGGIAARMARRGLGVVRRRPPTRRRPPARSGQAWSLASAASTCWSTTPGIGMRTVNPRFMIEPRGFWEVPPRGVPRR